MPKGMLGKLPLSEIRGPRDDLEEKLAGPEGGKWLESLKKFLRKENPFSSGIWNLRHRGVRYEERTSVEDFVGRREKAFADEWEKENKLRVRDFNTPPMSLLQALMNKNNAFIPVSQETATAVATIVQWLGSPVGWGFLNKVLEEAGYRIVEKK